MSSLLNIYKAVLPWLPCRLRLRRVTNDFRVTVFWERRKDQSEKDHGGLFLPWGLQAATEAPPPSSSN